MKLYAGIYLHSSSIFVGIVDENDRCVYRKKLANASNLSLEALKPFKKNLKGVVVESTFNWYWLVDVLID